jgi:hypothetical protein
MNKPEALKVIAYISDALDALQEHESGWENVKERFQALILSHSITPILLYNVYGHFNTGKPIIVQNVNASTGSEALDKVKALYPDARFNHVNLA